MPAYLEEKEKGDKDLKLFNISVLDSLIGESLNFIITMTALCWSVCPSLNLLSTSFPSSLSCIDSLLEQCSLYDEEMNQLATTISNGEKRKEKIDMDSKSLEQDLLLVTQREQEILLERERVTISNEAVAEGNEVKFEI